MNRVFIAMCTLGLLTFALGLIIGLKAGMKHVVGRIVESLIEGSKLPPKMAIEVTEKIVNGEFFVGTMKDKKIEGENTF